jgi:hypothetical protein
MKDKKAIKKDILDKFRDIRDMPEPVLPKNWLEYQYVDSLNPMERKLFDRAVKELIRKGLVEATEGVRPSLKLTEKGASLIY